MRGSRIEQFLGDVLAAVSKQPRQRVPRAPARADTPLEGRKVREGEGPLRDAKVERDKARARLRQYQGGVRTVYGWLENKEAEYKRQAWEDKTVAGSSTKFALADLCKELREEIEKAGL